MNISKRFLAIFLLIMPLSAIAQNCGYNIDTAKILGNRNLDKFITMLQTGTFVTASDKNAIPPGIKKQLRCMTEGFSIANPDQQYACCCTSSPELPYRKLLFLAKNKKMLVMTFLTGGIGVCTHIVFIEIGENGRIKDLWAGIALKDLKSKEQVLAFIKANRDKEEGLNTNWVYF